MIAEARARDEQERLARKPKPRGGNELTSDDDDDLSKPPEEAKDRPEEPTKGYSEVDSYGQRVYKLIPAEVTAGYIALLSGVGLLTGNDTEAAKRVMADDTTKWAPALAILAGTLWVLLALRSEGAKLDPPVKPMGRQYLITSLGFWAWAASISDPFAAVDRAIPAWILFFAIVLIPSLGAYWLNSKD
jgi:hypothetical protein